MGLFSFIKSAGKKLGLVDDEGETPPDAEAVKKELEGLNLGTDKVEVTVEGVDEEATFQALAGVLDEGKRI